MAHIPSTLSNYIKSIYPGLVYLRICSTLMPFLRVSNITALSFLYDERFSPTLRVLISPVVHYCLLSISIFPLVNTFVILPQGPEGSPQEFELCCHVHDDDEEQ